MSQSDPQRAPLDPPPPLLPDGRMNDAPVKPGDMLAGKYRVEKILGEGNMGMVVAATHLALGQLVALKFMKTSQSTRKEPRERFLREARAMARLRSQHVTRILDVGTLENGAPYMVMECLEGCDLAALLRNNGLSTVEEAVEYVLQALEAVAEAHAMGIVHRDIKPANLFLTTDTGGAPCIKVFDFGISKSAGDLVLTKDDQALGSPLYMSPEQMNSSKDVDGRTDLWALGAVLFELLAGQTPFDAATLAQLHTRVFHGDATPLDEFRTDIPPGLEAVILQCLERDREHRFRNAAELAAALAPWASARAANYPDRVARALGVHVAPAESTAQISRPSRLSAPGLAPPSLLESSSIAIPLTRRLDPARQSAPNLASSGSDVSLALAKSQRVASPSSARPRRRGAILIAGAVTFLALLIACVLAFRRFKLAGSVPVQATSSPSAVAPPAPVPVEVPAVSVEPPKSASPASTPAPSVSASRPAVPKATSPRARPPQIH